MDHWQTLVKTALLGTARQQTPITDAGASPLGMLPRLQTVSAEASLLSQAAVLALYQRAGQKPVPASAAPPPADEPLAPLSAKAGEFLGRMLTGDRREVLAEFLTEVAEAYRRIPERWLPQLMHLGRTSADLRPLILAVIGQRGRWLAAQNSEWNYVAGEGPPQAAWETEARPARLLLLQRLRQTDPAAARTLLASTWARESADDRAAFLGALVAGLSSEDEAFLESALDDRSKEVRRAAAGVLARLPQSAYATRMTARAAALLNWREGKTPRIEVTLPNQLDPAAARDGIESGNRRQGVGEKAWWLYQMLAAAPPSALARQWKKNPAQIVEAARDKEWRDLLLEAWATAAARLHDADWAEALWNQEIKAGIAVSSWDAYAILAPALPGARRENLIAQRVTQDPNRASDISDVPLMLKAYDQPWGKPLTRAVVGLLTKVAGEKNSGGRYRLRSALPDFARRVPPEMLAELTTGWPADGAGWDYWKEPVEQFLATVQFRHDMRAALKE